MLARCMKNSGILFSLVIALAQMAVWGRVQPSALFGDHAVLLKSADTPVFGFADPGERVRVTFGGVSAEGQADIQGETVVVSATQVPKPVAVRYGFAANPWVNLYNAEGLPAEPFEWRPSAAR